MGHAAMVLPRDSADGARLVRAAALLNTSASAHWEFMGHWPSAMHTYFPRYQQSAGGVKLFLMDQVPYKVPCQPWVLASLRCLGTRTARRRDCCLQTLQSSWASWIVETSRTCTASQAPRHL